MPHHNRDLPGVLVGDGLGAPDDPVGQLNAGLEQVAPLKRETGLALGVHSSVGYATETGHWEKRKLCMVYTT